MSIRLIDGFAFCLCAMLDQQEGARMMAEAAVTRYRCHECEQAIEAGMVEEVKCPICDGGFVEEMIGQEFEALSSRQSESGRGLSQWGGMLDSPFDQPEATRDSDDEDDDDNLGREFEGFIRRHRQAVTLRRVLNSIQDDLRVDRERDNSVLINAFNQALAMQGSVLDPDDVQGDQGGSNNDDGLLEEYVLGAGLSLLLQHLAENDPNRYGTPPAKEEVVEALPSAYHPN
jgi:E3 ubiquitin-protein ligase RNF115/126